MKVKKLQLIVEKATDLGEGIIEAVVASGKTDRHGESLDIQGLDTKSYMKNPVVLWAHDYQKTPIGQTLKLTKTKDGKLIAKVQFAINEDSFAYKVYRLYKGGFMRAFSIGFIPKDMDGDRYTKSEMIEHSAVPIPANDEALALALKSGVINKKDINAISKISKRGGDHMLKLKDILGKRPEDLTAEEQAYLIEKSEKLTDAQKLIFKEILSKGEEPAKPKKSKIKKLKKELKSLNDKLEKLEESLSKTVVKKNINIFRSVKNGDELGKEEKLQLWYKGLVSKDFSEYLEVTQKDAMNTSDDGEILPPEEFIAEVSRLEEEYGVASRFANVRRSTRPTLRGIKGGDDVEFVKTAEGDVKPSQRVTYDPFELTYLKYAAIVPVTDELLEDSAVDLWSDLTNRFARAAAKRQDELVFTENDTVSSVYGILNASGTARIAVGSIASFDDADATDALNEMMFSVPTPSMNRGRFYMHRTIFGLISRARDSQGRPLVSPGENGGLGPTIWGQPYTLTEVMPSLSEIEDGDPFMVFGDLRNTILGIRVPMQVKYFDTGIVTDPDNSESNLNLLTQDIQAIRARIRMNQVHVHPEAYSVLVAGNSIS